METCKREELLKIYDCVQRFVMQDDYDKDLRKELKVAFSGYIYDDEHPKNHRTEPNYLKILRLRKEDLDRMEYGITITGDTSSGKSSLVNKLVGMRLVTPTVLAATSKICRIRNTETLAIKCLDVNGEIVKDRTEFEDQRKMKMKLDKYTTARRRYTEMYYIDIYCPFQNLTVRENVMIVDTPGISGSEDNSVLMDFLPKAFGFIFVIDVTKAGGVEKDRILKILQTIVKSMYMMPCFKPEDVLFVINKWNLLKCPELPAKKACDDSSGDEEPINEKDQIWNTIVNEIKAVWPTLTTEQLFRLNLERESIDQDTEEERNQFTRFAEVLSHLLENTKNQKVEMHIRLLRGCKVTFRRVLKACRKNWTITSTLPMANLPF